MEIGTEIGREIRIENDVHFWSIEWHLVCVEIDIEIYFGINIEMASFFIFPTPLIFFAQHTGSLVGLGLVLLRSGQVPGQVGFAMRIRAALRGWVGQKQFVKHC